MSSMKAAVCESSVIPFLVPCRKVWLTPAAGVPCSNAANIEECKTWTKVNIAPGKILSGDKSPRKCTYSVAAQETAKHRVNFARCVAVGERRHCSNEGKTRNRLKFAGVPQTRQQISAINGQKFAIL